MIPQIKISFSLYGDCKEIDSVSDKLQIEASKIQKKKDFAVQTYAEDYWTLETGYEEVMDIGILTDKMYARLHKNISVINKTKKELSLESMFMIVIQADANEMPIIVLNKDMIKLAYETDSEVHFDNYFVMPTEQKA